MIHLLDWKIGKKATPSPGLLKKGILFPFFLEALANYSPKKSLSTRAPRTFIQTSIPEPYCETTHGLSTGSGPPGVRVLGRHDVLNVRPDPDDHLLILLELAHYGAAGEAPVLLLLEHLPLL